MLRPMVRQVERRARRLHDMIKALGVNEIAVIRKDQGEAYAEARDKCLHCASSSECLNWLEANSNGARDVTIPDFCRSKELFESCRR